MNSKIQSAIAILSVLFAILVFIAAPVFLFFLGRFLIETLKTLDPQVATTTVATVGTALTALVTIVLNQRWAKGKDIAESHRPQKVIAYKKFVKVLSKILKNTKKDKDFLKDGTDLPEDLLEEFFAFQEEFISWASPEVIKAFLEFRKSTNNPRRTIASVDSILVAIRKDLGHKDRDLKAGELISIFLSNPSDIDNLM